MLRLSFAWLVSLLLFAHSTAAYQVLVSDQDAVRQVCSGVWNDNELGVGKQDAFIEILFAPASRGQVALVVFEWEDARYLGIDPSGARKENDWEEDRVYICTLAARQAGLCETKQLGKFIVSNAPQGESSIWTTSVRFDPVPSSPVDADEEQLGTGPYRYEINKTGYYCVGTLPVSLQQARYNSSYAGVVDFETIYGGHLPGGEYPKVMFYKYLAIAYLAMSALWSIFCWSNRRDLLPIQTYITILSFFLLFEHFLTWRYENYLNNVGHPGVAGAYLVLVSVLSAVRNSLSLYLLCLASMGLSIVRPTLGTVLARVRLLGICHLVFGILYSLGTVAIPIDNTGFFVVFFVLPLAFTLTAFLTWIMYSLASTIADLSARRQTFKRTMFVRLQYILFFATSIIALFFVISAISFSARSSSSFPAHTWRTRWLFVEGWSSILYILVFSLIALLWRPTSNNRRLALSDELAQTDDEADLYDVEGLLSPNDRDERDGADELKDSFAMRRVSRTSEDDDHVGDDSVVFEVGGSDEDDDNAHIRKGGRRSGGGARKSEGGGAIDEERQRLRWSEGDGRQLDITNQLGGSDRTSYDAPPEYRSSKND